MNLKNIDWLNHAIAFGASVVGIFIAFQLDDWQDRRAKREQMEVSLQGIKMEIEGNLSVYHQNDSLLQQFLSYSDFFMEHTSNGIMVCTDNELEQARKMNPERFRNLKVVGKVNDSTKKYEAHLNIDIAPVTGITTGNWDAARSSGILMYVDHERVVLLTQVYDWTNKELGISDEEFHNNLISFGDFDNTENVFRDYRLIRRVSELKYSRMKEYYDQIKW